jgi:hypothetical protein
MAARPSLLPFIQEVFGVKQPFTAFVKRNKLLSFALLLNVLFFTVTLFNMEQNILKAKEVADLKRKLSSGIALLPNRGDCSTGLTALHDDYRQLNRLYGECISSNDSPPPIPKPTRNKDPVIIQRGLSDDSLKRKLDAIR